MTSEIPVMSVEYADIENNTSGMFDEAVAHRLGMIPLAFSYTYKLPEDCKCGGKGCSQCESVFVIDKEGPCTVFSGDMKGTDEEVRPVDSRMPIAELLEGQKLKLEATARLGFGSSHAKNQAANAGYKYSPSVRIADCPECANVCPANVFEKKDGKVRVAKAENCVLCMKCADYGASVSADESRIIFTVESVCGLSAKDILLKSLDALEERSEEFIKEAKKELK